MRVKLILSVVLIPFYCYSFKPRTVHFKAKDGLEVTADVYLSGENSRPFIILFHQAGWSRGEYLEIAPKLNALGFNCMAVDQRSGNAVNNITNETNKEAKAKGFSTEMVSAIPDIEGAIQYVKDTYHPSRIITWGSSYSAALVLKVAGDNPGVVDGVLSFSPGEYFKEKDFISSSASSIEVPVFITSAKNEKNNWDGIYAVIPSTRKMSYLPETNGNHGSRSLWSKFSDSEGYWESVKEFLKQFTD